MANNTKDAILITGASSGIGAACALRLGERGHGVFAGVRKDSDGAAPKQKSSTVIPVMIDVTDAASIAAAATTVAEAVGDQGLAGLVNNAGVVVPGPLEFLDIDDLRK